MLVCGKMRGLQDSEAEGYTTPSLEAQTLQGEHALHRLHVCAIKIALQVNPATYKAWGSYFPERMIFP